MLNKHTIKPFNNNLCCRKYIIYNTAQWKLMFWLIFICLQKVKQSTMFTVLG